MKFDLEAFKKHGVALDREGRKYTFVAHVPMLVKKLSVVSVRDGCTYNHSESGNHYGYRCDSASDLVEVVALKRTVWVNFYANGCAHWHSGQEAAIADDYFTYNQIGKAIPVEIDA